MSMKIGPLFIALVFVSTLLTGCKSESTEEKDLPTVKSFLAVSKDCENNLSYSGYAAADELKRFSFETAGTIKNIYVEKGDAVKNGQVIAELDTEVASMQIDAANENISMAQNKIAQSDTAINEAQVGVNAENLTLEKLKKNIDLENINLKKIQDTYTSAITQLQLNYDDAKKQYENMKVMYDAGGCSKDALDKVKLTFDTVKDELENQKTSMNNDISIQNKKIDSLNDDYSLQETKIQNQKNKLEQAKQQKEAAKITLNQAKITLDQNNKILKDSLLKSTIDGYVTEVPMNAGEVTSAGNPVVVVKSDNEIVNVAIPTEDYGNFYNGMSAKLTQDKNTIDGKVTSISLYPDETTRTYNIEITPDKNNAFALGSVVDVKVLIDSDEFIHIPLSSLFNIDGIDYVYCIEKDENNQNVIKSQEVEIKQSDGENIYVNGIKNGTLVVANEVKNLHDNQNVNVIGG